ncbi:MAG: phosphotransferase [Xanthomonadaceae bacterium]|nr:phosphotransferase [Xanthomonadaceae bacterium]
MEHETVPGALDLPLDALGAWLATRLPDLVGPLRATRFKGGQSNPTFLIESASARCVLRRKPPGTLLASAHAIDREFRVLSALHGGTIPVPRPLLYCADAGIIGSAFYLMEAVDGRVAIDPALPGWNTRDRSAGYAAILAALTALAGLDVDAAGLADYGKPGNYFARQVARWSGQYRASETARIEPMDALIAALPGAVPADDGRIALVHGDFRVDNLVWDTAAPMLHAVLDWELSTLGHPYADISYFCMALRLPRNPVLPGLAGIDRATLGIPSEAELLDGYRARTGLDPRPHWPFLLAFQFFRLAAIAQGVARRAAQGNASSVQATQAGAMTRTIAELGVQALSSD